VFVEPKVFDPPQIRAGSHERSFHVHLDAKSKPIGAVFLGAFFHCGADSDRRAEEWRPTPVGSRPGGVQGAGAGSSGSTFPCGMKVR
jgi:hypothetical protein